MREKESMIYICWTCRDKLEAKKIIRQLLEDHLIACASILPEVESIYRWNGNIEESREVKVLLKTASRQYSPVQDFILSNCSYQIPEITQLSVGEANPTYLAWVVQETVPKEID